MWLLLINNFPLFLMGIKNTLLLTFGAAFFGIIVAISLIVIKLAKIRLLNHIVDLYLFIVRGTPFLLQLFIIYYGTMQFACIAHSMLAILFKSATYCALLALIVNTSAYTTVLFIGAIENLPQQQIMAAKSLGMSKFNIYKRIILPQMLIKILPVYGNELIMLLKCTAIVSSITIVDVMGAAQQVMAMTYQNLPCLLIAAIIYLIITVIIVLPLKFNVHT
jgi:His/Glu/Gln/Arg/opine family amino acid ABC transporter permease subunit